MTLNTVSFSQEEFTSLRDILLEHTGISIADHKQTLMEGRLIKRLRKLGISTCREYIEYLYSTESEKSEFINLMTTNKTEFFREAHHFDFINQIAIPELLKLTGRRSIDIWSAASAIGEEAYTLAIVLN